ncbi:MAG: hypothetical protein FJZ04_04350 [Candidatus Moranbacteria bacterium]|nr:hypothetical protein [Candidatus Moranbacteria bacterium]
MSKSFIVSATILVLIAIALALGFFYWNEIRALLGMSDRPPIVKNLNGQPININAGGQQLTVPPILSDDILNYLKQELTENAGMPLKVERKGNSLPFGIP